MGWTTSGSPAKRVAVKPSGRVMALGASFGGMGLSPGAAARRREQESRAAFTAGVSGGARALLASVGMQARDARRGWVQGGRQRRRKGVTSHSLTVLSWEALARVLPSGPNRTDQT